jgi:uncharacterized protein YbjT (DUF2867 family)
MKRTALLAGASGLVGGFCLKELLEEPGYSHVTTLVRTSLGLKHPKLTELVLDFDHLKAVLKDVKVDDVFCALGTTRKKSPTPEAYRKIDYDYVVRLALATHKNKAKQFLVVSAMGANPDSSIPYSRLKGEMEKAVREVHFESLHIFQPSFITGEKGRKERRPMEKVMEWTLTPLSFLFAGPLKKYKPISAHTIAKAMVRTAQEGLHGNHVWPSDQIAAKGGSMVKSPIKP